MILIKLSAPGWEKTYSTEKELRNELLTHICNECMDGYEYTDQDGDVVCKEDPITEESTLGDILATACGAEFMVEE